jgi:hypothetical protein
MRESPQGAGDQRSKKLVRLAQPGAEVKDRSRTRRRKLLGVKEGGKRWLEFAAIKEREAH